MLRRKDAFGDVASVVILGGDGFCGWPTALDQSSRGRSVTIIDNLSRRHIDKESGFSSLTPIRSPEERISAWKSATGSAIRWIELDVAENLEALTSVFREIRPDAVVHFAEQRSAPYSMLSPSHRAYTISNNVGATQNVLEALRSLDPSPHLVHLGSVGVYGYSSRAWKVPEGYLKVTVPHSSEPNASIDVLHPFEPVSIYHLTKCIDAQMFEFYSRYDRLRVTDLHQGIVWGTQTKNTEVCIDLLNRFDYDAVFGTVVNRFLLQAAIEHPLTVYGSGQQTRAFIHLDDAATCINLALENPPTPEERVCVRNQVAECLSVLDVAEIVANITGVKVALVPNPRSEADSNTLSVTNQGFHDLGLRPRLMRDDIRRDSNGVVRSYCSNVDLSAIMAGELEH